MQEHLSWLMYLGLISEHHKIELFYTSFMAVLWLFTYFSGNITAGDVLLLFSHTTCCWTILIQQQISVKANDVTNQLSVRQPRQNVQ